MRFEFLSPIHKATRQIGSYLEPRCAQAGVSNREGHLLSYLRSYEPVTIGGVLRVFGERPSTVTSMLDRLASQGLIRRAPGKEDRRQVVLTLTAKGRASADRLRRCLADFEAKIRADMDPRDLQGFQAVLDAIARVTTADVAGKESPR